MMNEAPMKSNRNRTFTMPAYQLATAILLLLPITLFLSIPGFQAIAAAAVTAEPGYGVTLLNDGLSGPVEIKFAPAVSMGSASALYVTNEGPPGGSPNQDFISKLSSSNGTTSLLKFIDGLEGPSGLVVDNEGNIYVSQDAEIPLRKYDSQGVSVLTFESHRPDFADPNTLALTGDGRLLAAVQHINSPGLWRILAFDIASGERRPDFTEDFAYDYVSSIVFMDGLLYIAGTPPSGTMSPLLVVTEGSSPAPFSTSAQWPAPLNGFAIGNSGLMYGTTIDQLLKINPDGSTELLAKGFEFARGLLARNSGCIQVVDYRSGSNGALYQVCATWTGTISGTVYDKLSSTPVSMVPVSLFPPNGGGGVGGTCTDSSGNFQIRNAPPGSYVAVAGGGSCDNNSPVVYALTAYDGTSGTYDWSRATVFSLERGTAASTSGVNFHLVEGAYVSGRATDQRGDGVANIPVMVSGSITKCTDAGGYYKVAGTSPGSVTVTAGGMICVNNGPAYVRAWYGENSGTTLYPNEAKVFSLTSGQRLTDINLTGLIPAAIITGKVRNTENLGVANVTVSYWGTSGPGIYGTRTGANGDYRLYVPGGTWKIEFNPREAGANYLDQWYNNQRSAAAANPVTVTAGTVTSGIDARLERLENGGIDGDPGEWTSITPAYSNASTTGTCGPNADIKAVYTRMDNDYAYIMLETLSRPIKPSVGVEINLDYQPGQQFNHGPLDDLHLSIGNSSLRAWTSGANGTLVDFPISGYSVAYGDVMEVRIPRSALGNPTYFQTTFANLWDPDFIPPGSTTGCDPTTTTSITSPTGTILDFQGRPVPGARIEQTGNPGNYKVSASDGSFDFIGLRSAASGGYSLKITKDGYRTEYTDNNPRGTLPFILFTEGDVAPWGIEAGKSAIVGSVRDSSGNAVDGAMINCISKKYGVCYPIKYPAGGGPTSANDWSRYLIANVEPGDTVQVSATNGSSHFNPRTFVVHDDGISFGYVSMLLPTSNPITTLAVNKSGVGTGSVSSSPGPITGTTNSYYRGTVVTITATPDPGSTSVQWSGCDAAYGERCYVMMVGQKTVTATFTDTTAPTVTPSTPPGVITSPTSITLSSNESATIYFTTDGSDPTTGSAVYSGPISITGTTTIKYFAVDNNGNPGPIISLPYVMTYTLNVQKTGQGEGVVSSAGTIDCGSSCTASYAAGSSVTLRAEAGANSAFVGWSGDCANAGQQDCTMMMDANRIVTAEFCKNLPPALSPIGDKSVNEGALLQFTVSATDPEGNALTYSAKNLPPGATFDPATQRFTWTPSYDQAGIYANVEFTVTDDGKPVGVDSKLITMTVGNVNRPPVFTPVAPKTVIEGQLIQFTVSATDPDGDSITEYFTEPLPAGASFDPAARTFSWTPDYDQAGTKTIVFFASDGYPGSLPGRTEVVISVNVPPPDVLINQTVNAVYAMHLPKEVENSYIANLKKVGIFINDGKVIPAVNQLNAAIKKIQTDVAGKKISQVNGNRLTMMITLLMNELNS